MKRLFPIFFIVFCSTTLNAQFHNGLTQDFGKNRIQYDDKFWLYLRHENFDVYYDKAGRQLAQFVAQNVDCNYADIKKTLEFEYSRRIVFVLYNTISDFRQSNIGYSTAEDDYNVGGTTQTIDNKVSLYFNGDHNNLVQQIRKGIAEVMMNEFLFGIGTYRRILSNSAMASFPEWFFDGMTAYFSGSWSANDEDGIRQLAKNRKCEKISNLYDENAAEIGHALWVFVAEKYGEKTISNILYMSKLTEDIDASFQYVLGKDLQTVLLKMNEHYTNGHTTAESTQGARIPLPNKLAKRAITDIALNNDGTQLSFVTNQQGKAQLWVCDLNSKTFKKVFRIGSAVEQANDTRYPIAQWHPKANALAYFHEKNNQMWFTIFNPETKEKVAKKFFHFEQVLDFSYSPDGTRIVFTGVQAGQTDIFTYNIQTFENEQITNDIADERFPIFAKNGSDIVFTSNRADNNLKNHAVGINPTYDLFVLKGNSLERIPISSADEWKATEYVAGKYLYLSNLEGQTRMYATAKDSTISFIDTALHYSYTTRNFAVKQPAFNIHDYALANGTLIQMGEENGRRFLYSSSIFEKKFAPISIMDSTQSAQDSTLRDTAQWEQKAGNLYKTNFYINSLVNQLDFSFVNSGYQKFTGGAYYYNQNVNLLMKLGIIDLFEDYRLTGAYRFTGSFGSNEYLISVENLSKRLDRQYIFHRQSYVGYGNSGYKYQRTQDNHIVCRLKYPLTQLQSVSVSPNFRYVRNITLATDMSTLQEPDVNEYWLGVSCNYVFDNAKKRDLNIYNGIRAKVFAEGFAQVNKADSYLCVFGLDFRHYQKIHRNLILASRIAYSTSFGTSPLLYYLGAVDNWINLFSRYNTYNTAIQYDHATDWAYQAIGTNLRGFSQNIRNGNSFAVANLELRWPVIQYFAAKPLKSDILRNFQIVGFADFGGAWSGLYPGAKENAYRYTVINQPPVHVKIDEMRQPFVCGYGAGLRTRIFGYFVRLDFAWGNDEGATQRMNQFSVGMDF